MATNYVETGKRLTLAAPYAVASGAGALIGSHIFAVALQTLANAASGEWATDGVWDLKCLSTDTPAVGAVLYWDNSAKQLTTTSTSNSLVGVAVLAKLTGATTVRIRLNGIAV